MLYFLTLPYLFIDFKSHSVSKSGAVVNMTHVLRPLLTGIRPNELLMLNILNDFHYDGGKQEINHRAYFLRRIRLWLFPKVKEGIDIQQQFPYSKSWNCKSFAMGCLSDLVNVFTYECTGILSFFCTIYGYFPSCIRTDCPQFRTKRVCFMMLFEKMNHELYLSDKKLKILWMVLCEMLWPIQLQKIQFSFGTQPCDWFVKLSQHPTRSWHPSYSTSARNASP